MMFLTLICPSSFLSSIWTTSPVVSDLQFKFEYMFKHMHIKIGKKL